MSVHLEGGDGLGKSTSSVPPAPDSRLTHDLIARRAFEISLTVDATPEENWALAEAELIAELGFVPPNKR